MESAQVVALAAFGLLALAVGFVTRRLGVLLARTRLAEGYRGSIGDLSRRADLSLREIGDAIDACRRGAVGAEAIRADIRTTRDALDRYLREARSLAVPDPAAAAHQAFVAELERAERALELVDHGCQVQDGAWRGEVSGESQTAIKRGFLNLVHARESMLRQARDARSRAAEASPARRLRRREHHTI